MIIARSPFTTALVLIGDWPIRGQGGRENPPGEVTSGYARVAGTRKGCPQHDDSPTFCIDLGPDAHELHAGDAGLHLRLAVGWQF